MTTNFKDLFSHRSSDYARFRPRYPDALFAWLSEQAPARRVAVDVGTGNGQAAVALAAHFDQVIGVDPSAAQLENAIPHARVAYRTGAAEATGVDTASADFMGAAQAFHWFRRQPFFDEARRVIRPGGLLAVWSYGLTTITPAVDAAVMELYRDHLDDFWEPERRTVESGYRDIVFPFPEIAPPAFGDMTVTWTFDELLGYLGTWSARQKYIQQRGTDPLALVLPRLQAAWGTETAREIAWPLAVRAFRL